MSSPDFEPERYADEYRERALAMIEQKVKGQEIKAVPLAPRRSGQVVDIFAALKKSWKTAGQQKATADRGSAKGRRRDATGDLSPSIPRGIIATSLLRSAAKPTENQRLSPLFSAGACS